MMMYGGCDIGKGGALALIDDSGEIIIVDFDKDFVVHTLRQHKDKIKIMCVEKVHARPNQGTVSMFSFGENFGWWQ